MLKIQQSYKDTGDLGKLYLVPTPIGNLDDMTFRAIDILKTADLIAAEDTRHSKKLCHYFNIDTPLTSYHEHNKETSGSKLVELLKNGKIIALVTDAGMPGISDPGYDITKLCLSEGIDVIPLPGANAALSTLIASGLSTNHFYFHGFLPRQNKERKKELDDLKRITSSLILYEAPHRLKETLKALSEDFGERQMAIGRELTKKFETFIRGTVNEVMEWAQTEEIKGECCIILEGAKDVEIIDNQWWEALEIVDHVNHYIEREKMTSKDAIKRVAQERHIPKREVYQAYHINA